MIVSRTVRFATSHGKRIFVPEKKRAGQMVAARFGLMIHFSASGA